MLLEMKPVRYDACGDSMNQILDLMFSAQCILPHVKWFKGKFRSLIQPSMTGGAFKALNTLQGLFVKCDLFNKRPKEELLHFTMILKEQDGNM